jgi:hypothetical protein
MPRKRKTNVERFPSGQIKPPKLGPTAELIAKRVALFTLAGVKANPPPDLRLAESWMGILFAAGVLDQQEYDAGNKLHGMWRAINPSGFPGSTLDEDAPRIAKDKSSDLIPYQRVEAEDGVPNSMYLSLKKSQNILVVLGRETGFGHRIYDLVVNVCVFGRFYRFMDTTSPRPKLAWREDSKDRTLFVAGLGALAMAYGYKGIA